MLRSILFQSTLIGFAISCHIPYKTSTLQSIQFISVYFCLNLISCLPLSFIVYCHVVIHFVTIHSGWIHHLPSRSILNPSHCNTFSSFPTQSDFSTPITFCSVLSSWNKFCSNPPKLDSSSPVMLQIKTFMLWYIKFLSIQSNALPCTPFHSAFSRCNPFCSKPSQLDIFSYSLTATRTLTFGHIKWTPDVAFTASCLDIVFDKYFRQGMGKKSDTKNA